MQASETAVYQQLNDLIEGSPENWRSTSSKTCYMFNAENGALSMCNYFDSTDVKNIGIYSIDNEGDSTELLVINSASQPELYQTFLELYEKIKSQVLKNQLNSVGRAIADMQTA